MATIKLNPGEKFEHKHDIQSFTELLEGKIILRYLSNEMALKKGVKIIIPANTSHSVENVGAEVAMFACAYGPPK